MQDMELDVAMGAIDTFEANGTECVRTEGHTALLDGLPAKTSAVAKGRISIVLAVLLLSTLVAFASGAATATQAYAKQPAEGQQKAKVAWIKKGGNVYCKVDGKKQKGLVTIEGRKYLFGKNGVQRNGWQKVGENYYFFKTGNGAKGSMVRKKVVNGVRLLKDGKASLNSETRAEMRVLIAAQQFVEKYTKPTWSNNQKLSKSFRVLVYKYNERLWHKFSAAKGWARREASDIFFRKSGPCFAYGAAIAYIGNAIGYRNCVAVSSGGHGWGMIDGKVYDPEWTKHQSAWLYAVRLGSGVGGVGYAGAGRFKYYISPHPTELGSGNASKSATKVGSSAKKPSGKKTGWNAAKTKYYKKGRMLKGDSAINGKFFAFTSKGLYSSKRTRQLRAACKAEEDIAPLKALIGEPSSSVYQPTCNLIKGMGMGDGSQDGILKYKNFTVYTFKGTDGVERFMGVEAN